MDTPLVINIDTGVISFRTEENAQQCNCRPISHRHAKMVESGELEIKPLLAAIKKHMMSADGFNYDKYADERRKLNVRHAALHADERASVKDADASEYTSDDEISAARENVEPDAVDAAANEVAKTHAKRTRGRPKVVDSDDSTENESVEKSGVPGI